MNAPATRTRLEPSPDQAAGLRALASAIRRDEHPRDPAATAARPLSPVVCICSGKGGVGKTMIAANLSLCLARRGASPILIDADIGTPNADLVLGVSAARRMDHLKGTLTADSLSAVAVTAQEGLRLLPGVAGNTWVTDHSADACSRLLRSASELTPRPSVIVVDAGAGIGPTVMNFAALADLTLIVVTPDPTSIADAYATIKSAHRRASDCQRSSWRPALLVNEASGPAEAARTRDRVSQCALRFLGLAPMDMGWVPLSAEIRTSVRQRTPLVMGSAENAAFQAVHLLSEAVARALELPDNRARGISRAARFLRMLWSGGPVQRP